ncbi:MAG: AraC family transcriptional regulator, partial [Bacteroidota bacterium]
LLVAKFDKSREIIMRGAYNKLTIVFNSLGLNHFLDIPLGKIAQDHFALFEHYGEDFEKIIQEIFNADHLEDKRDLLDAFFLSKLVGFQEERLSYAVQAIHTHGGDVSIQKIAKELGISRRTLLRLFHTHLALSPVEYKSIIKFRRALDIYQNQVEKTNISTLSYEANFYDQSDLNFHFKAKTGLSPKQLFSTIKTVNQDLYWKMERVPKFQDNQM